MKPITEIASLGLSSDIDLYGKYKAKVSLEVLENFLKNPRVNTLTSPLLLRLWGR